MDAAQQALYREVFLDHSHAPRNRGRPESGEPTARHRDPETGDEVAVWLALESGRVGAIRWEAQGSSVLAASCSLMSEHLTGRTPGEALSAIGAFIAMLTGTEEPADWEALGEAAALSGIRHLPARVRCAALPWRTAEVALKSLQ